MKKQFYVAVLLSAALLNCNKDPHNPAAATAPTQTNQDPASLKPVAKVGDAVITSGEFLQTLQQQNPYVRARFSSPERKKEFLNNLIRLEILAQEAKKRGLDQDPAVMQQVKRALAERLVAQLNEELVKLADITDADVKAYYEKNKSTYQQPAMARIVQILVPTEAEAKKVLKVANERGGNVYFFGELARKYSTDVETKERGGDTEFFSADTDKIPPELVKAAFAQTGLFKVVGPIKTGKGWALFIKTQSKEAIARSLEEEAPRIKNQLFNERRYKSVEQFAEKLQKDAKIVINEQNLAKVDVVPQKSAVPGNAGNPVPLRN